MNANLFIMDISLPIRLAALGVATALAAAGCATVRPAPGPDAPPQPMREFRAAWIATVANIDWPSRPGLDPQQQRAELTAIFDRAAALNLNAVVLQVRPAGDAFYDSPLEPWSAWLTGEQGAPPEPYYDPLAFAIEQAHQRGLELHAWFNPYRVGHPSHSGDYAPSHISNTRPDLVRQYGPLLWLDPGHPDVQQHSLDVILDAVRRYDLDGIHLDDYFYPYPRRQDGAVIPFPDDETYEAYGRGLSRDDWRRRNVDRFIERMYAEVKRVKPHVKVGISPFGIWKPGDPPWIVGMNQHDAIYADARKWLRRGWCDYFTPQLYWRIANPDQSFVSLLEWWNGQNVRRRHLWPGLAAYRVGEDSAKGFDEREIGYQIEWTRLLVDGDPGEVLFSFKALMKNQGGLADQLASGVYREPALVPASPWLGDRAPAPPVVEMEQAAGELRVDLAPQADARWRLVQVKRGGAWSMRLYPVSQARIVWPFDGDGPEVERVVVRAVSPTGVLSRPAGE